ncbi:hypothetical protein BSIN_2387 [Burkholderia singularis]|uniref:Uncharacterized protein n=1 Tax=Burkholderia singularis TaxID=1503053 RepID=A0A238H1Q1_9BURK|nr:hypothetical protein BSIN_2387 [Burkholderia singularis]
MFVVYTPNGAKDSIRRIPVSETATNDEFVTGESVMRDICSRRIACPRNDSAS